MDLRIPLPLPSSSGSSSSFDTRRLWIGNLDKRVTEFIRITDDLCSNNPVFCFAFYWLQLVKILQNYGPIENFDLLYHKAGPEAGLPRGYAFVTYRDERSALKLKSALDGKKLGVKTLSIQWAHNVDKETGNLRKTDLNIPALGVRSKQEPKSDNLQAKIQAIEAKLKMMSQLPDEEFKLTSKASSSLETTATACPKKPSQPRNDKRNLKYAESCRFKPYLRR